MHVFMLGWEHPPVHSGGLGVATCNLAKSLSERGIFLHFAVPSFVHQNLNGKVDDTAYNLVSHEHKEKYISTIKIPSTISSPYLTEQAYQEFVWEKSKEKNGGNLYGRNLFEEIDRYAGEIDALSRKHHFDIIHAHDWMTYPAAVQVKKQNDSPTIMHMHSTEIDRTGGNPNPDIFELEKNGLESADKIIAVSEYTKTLVQKEYSIKEEKISAIHNGVEDDVPEDFLWKPNKERKIVLFLGRLTIQKGPDWLLKIAKEVLAYRKDVDFLIAGTGDMFPRLMREVIAEGLTDNIHFLGFVNAAEREKAFQNADCYIMPSISEPFGLSAVEAAQRGVPVILSRQSGAAEVLPSALAGNFWDTRKMAGNILSILEYEALQQTLSKKAKHELRHLTWGNQAGKVHEVYEEVLSVL